MMPLPVCRKRRAVEKVENLYRTARAQNDSIDTSEQIRSRLRDPLATDGKVSQRSRSHVAVVTGNPERCRAAFHGTGLQGRCKRRGSSEQFVPLA
jgi:hypothetical protein